VDGLGPGVTPIHDTSVSGDGIQTRAHKLVLLPGTGPILILPTARARNGERQD
jgi:hypothetical protein